MNRSNSYNRHQKYYQNSFHEPGLERSEYIDRNHSGYRRDNCHDNDSRNYGGNQYVRDDHRGNYPEMRYGARHEEHDEGIHVYHIGENNSNLPHDIQRYANTSIHKHYDNRPIGREKIPNHYRGDTCYDVNNYNTTEYRQEYDRDGYFARDIRNADPRHNADPRDYCNGYREQSGLGARNQRHADCSDQRYYPERHQDHYGGKVTHVVAYPPRVTHVEYREPSPCRSYSHERIIERRERSPVIERRRPVIREIVEPAREIIREPIEISRPVEEVIIRTPSLVRRPSREIRPVEEVIIRTPSQARRPSRERIPEMIVQEEEYENVPIRVKKPRKKVHKDLMPFPMCGTFNIIPRTQCCEAIDACHAFGNNKRKSLYTWLTTKLLMSRNKLSQQWIAMPVAESPDLFTIHCAQDYNLVWTRGNKVNLCENHDGHKLELCPYSPDSREQYFTWDRTGAIFLSDINSCDRTLAVELPYQQTYHEGLGLLLNDFSRRNVYQRWELKIVKQYSEDEFAAMLPRAECGFDYDQSKVEHVNFHSNDGFKDNTLKTVKNFNKCKGHKLKGQNRKGARSLSVTRDPFRTGGLVSEEERPRKSLAFGRSFTLQRKDIPNCRHED